MVKLLVKNANDSNTDPYLALLNYRSTPLSHGKSPAELLFNRKLKTCMPQLLQDESVQAGNVVEEKHKAKQTQKKYYDKGSRQLKELNPNDRVRMHDGKKWSLEARILQNVAPRSYVVQTSEGVTYRRNRRHLLEVPEREQTIKVGSNSDGNSNPVSQVQETPVTKSSGQTETQTEVRRSSTVEWLKHPKGLLNRCKSTKNEGIE